MAISTKYLWKQLTPDDGKHYFFGYYDRNPWDEDNFRHLALQVDQCLRIPAPGEKAVLGYVTRDGDGFHQLTETQAWCHQQGCMSLWLKHLKNTIVYNDLDAAGGKVRAHILEIGKGVQGMYDLPLYAMSPDGRWGASLNFGRIPRRGYSYACAPLPAEKRRPDLDDDGIFLMDMHSGKSKLLVSYRQIVENHPIAYDLEDNYWWLNHIIFNCDSSKLLFLFRYCPDPLAPDWRTYMYTVNLDGSDLACTISDFYWQEQISHQIWGRTPDEVLIDANWRGKGSEYVVFDNRERPLRAKLICRGQGPMGHLIFSPDGNWMLADSYPVKNTQHLALVDPADGTMEILGDFHHELAPGCRIDVRCDLHPRWSPDGKYITVDSITSGKRAIYMLDFGKINKK